MLPASTALAGDVFWTGGAALPTWGNGANWNTGVAPAAGDNVFFDLATASPSPVLLINNVASDVNLVRGNWNFTGDASSTLVSSGLGRIDNASAASDADAATLLLNAGATWTSLGGTTVGGSGFGEFTVADGAGWAGARMTIGDLAGSTGVTTVAGPGSTLQANVNAFLDGFFIGKAGTGTLNVFDGALAQINPAASGVPDFLVGNDATGSGAINIAGAGSQVRAEDLLLGRLGHGELNITAGGFFNGNIGLTADSFLAHDAASTAVATVSGQNSRWHVRRLDLGYGGTADVSIENGGLLRAIEASNGNNGDVLIGTDATGVGNLAVFGASAGGQSRVDADDNFYVGYYGQGTLRVGQRLDGSTVGTGRVDVDVDLRIGEQASNTFDNRAIVDGAGASMAVGGTLYAGSSGRGRLDVMGGGRVEASFLRVAGGPSSTGDLVIDGQNSLLDTTLTSSAGNAAIGGGGTGTAVVRNGARLNTNLLWVGQAGSAVGTLTIDNATVQGGTENANGQDLMIGGRIYGAGGTGTVLVQNGASLASRVDTYVGGNASGTGTLTVTGAGSRFIGGDNPPNVAPDDIVFVGFNGGQGTLEVLGGGQMDAEAVQVGSGSGSRSAEIIIDGPGSVLSSQNHVTIGQDRGATVTVSDGGQLNVATSAYGTVANNRLNIGLTGAADGSSLTVTGDGSAVNYFGYDRISVGNSGGSRKDPSRLDILDGGKLNAVQRDATNNILSSGFLMIADESDSNGVVTVDGVGSSAEVRYIHVGDGPSNSEGQLFIRNGGRVDVLEYVQVAANGAALGVTLIDGPGSELNIGTFLSIGDDLPTDGPAAGSMTIANGGTTSVAGTTYVGHYSGSFGTLNVGQFPAGGTATSTLDIGGNLILAGTETSSQSSGAGHINLRDKGFIDVDGDVLIRNLGRITMAGGELAVGRDLEFVDANATLDFQSGTLRFTRPAGHTFEPGDLSDILGAAHTLLTGQTLAVTGAAVLTEELRLNGGVLSVGSMNATTADRLDFDKGTLRFTGSGLQIGAGGPFGSNATFSQEQHLEVTNVATVDAGANLTLVGGYSAAATINYGELTLIQSAGTKQIDGAVQLADGSATTVLGNIQFNDLVSGPGHFFGPGNAIFNGGYNPGGGAGRGGDLADTIEFEGDVTFTSGNVLQLEFFNDDDFDRLDVRGNVVAGGTLEVLGGTGYAPLPNETYEVMTYASFAGNFDLIDNGTGRPGLMVDFVAGATSGHLVASAVFDGDANLDGTVDLADFVILRNNFSQPGNWLAADFNGDDVVDLADFVILRNNFGSTMAPGLSWGTGGDSPGGSAGDLQILDQWRSTVPEPGSLGLLAVMGTLAFRRRR